MLIQFTLKNFLSFKEEATLDMSAINIYKEHEYNLMEITEKDKLLKVAAIYGANASGKSNIFSAFATFQKIIIESFNNVAFDEKLPIHKYFRPFQFDKDKNNTEFEIILLLDGCEYQYGFEYNDRQIVAEWLYRKKMSNGEKTALLEREGDIKFNAEIKEECALYQQQIPSETLALTFLSRLRLKNNIMKKIYTAITDITIISGNYYNPVTIQKLLPNIISKDKGNLLEFLSAVDTGIKNISYKQKDQNLYFCTTHMDEDGNHYRIPLYDESEGTIKSIIVYVQAKNAILNNKVVLIDELNAQLHPLLLKFIIDLFYTSKSESQLIYTTHDTTLLDQRFFRRDQIWFVKKDAQGHSTLTSLAEFKFPRNGSYGINYLAGVYGAIPQLHNFDIKAGD